ncbi:hypothetical protein [Vibrio quintilis]|uniref:Uncharacterized protein n=1 Tax=Vibrio quintilis TaxID=1117707 RepID=A0A1M7YVY2_9VIBR|nr:hypothetical protein [Vibrio quintilis]SHO56764.1 hypothetical protein VQ7734_02533 [Vibrio quintilis]
MPVTITFDPHLSQKSREYLIQLEDHLDETGQNNQKARDALLYLNKLLTIHASIQEVTTMKVEVPE